MRVMQAECEGMRVRILLVLGMVMLVLHRVDLAEGMMIFSAAEKEARFFWVLVIMGALGVVATLLLSVRQGYRLFFGWTLFTWIVYEFWFIVGASVDFKENVPLAQCLTVFVFEAKKLIICWGISGILQRMAMTMVMMGAVFLYFVSVMGIVLWAKNLLYVLKWLRKNRRLARLK